ncbi:uncharacterized protein LOC115443759 isoform X2 [Manduca sexta]|uniref:Uncharacterized protein n=1 Tax=Manduca sexta TaxID=7130 RepID=A0A921Z420_MANSE|nr:uncharacterized protein LOC115443759 isoform X2 [Manduca sexta]KAG6450460.1 hypothetical protein O3G_MSEX006639 [Manduca sexta]
MDLKKLADEIDDITDPTAIEKVLFHIYQIQEEDDEFMELLIETCKEEIVLWEQPWYQLSSCLTRKLQETNENADEQYRTDAISKKEDEKIKKNWRKFIKKYNLPDKFVSFARWRNKHGCRNPNAQQEKVRRYVAAYLARGLQRTIYQVYKYVMTHTGENVKKQYTPEEEKIMKVCFYHKPEKAVTYLSAILCREPRGIYKRLAYINNGKPPRKRMNWTLNLATKFLTSLMKHTGLTVDELKY